MITIRPRYVNPKSGSFYCKYLLIKIKVCLCSIRASVLGTIDESFSTAKSEANETIILTHDAENEKAYVQKIVLEPRKINSLIRGNTFVHKVPGILD